MKKIRVVIVDDSSFMLNATKLILKDCDSIEIVATFRSGLEAVEFLKKESVDVFILDINMPEIDGVETTKRIMTTKPTPILILTAAQKSDTRVIKALESGAVDFLQKPGGKEISTSLWQAKQDLIEKTKSLINANLSGVKDKISISTKKSAEKNNVNKIFKKRVDLILIGTSTGGPSTLSKIISNLPEDFKKPILIVQHIGDGYSASLANSLNKKSCINVKEAGSYESIKSGNVYIAKAGFHLEVSSSQKIRLIKSAPEKGFMPSVNVLFRSAAKNYKGQILGIILTGMGNDGTEGCKKLKEKGHYIITQDEKSSIVWGMPKEVFLTGCYDKILDINGILNTLIALK